MILTLQNEVIVGKNDEGHSGLRINGRQILQEADFLRADSIDLFNRKNQSTTLTFKTNKKFTDQAEADTWMLDRLPVLLDLCGLLKLTCFSESRETNRYIKKAAVASITTSEIGVSVDLFWEVRGGKILTEKP